MKEYLSSTIGYGRKGIAHTENSLQTPEVQATQTAAGIQYYRDRIAAYTYYYDYFEQELEKLGKLSGGSEADHDGSSVFLAPNKQVPDLNSDNYRFVKFYTPDLEELQSMQIEGFDGDLIPMLLSRFNHINCLS